MSARGRLSTDDGGVEEKVRRPAGPEKFSTEVKQRQGGGRSSRRMAGRPRRGKKLVDGEDGEGERERLRGNGKLQGEEGERVTFDDVLAELGEFGREQKVNVDDIVIIS